MAYVAKPDKMLRWSLEKILNSCAFHGKIFFQILIQSSMTFVENDTFFYELISD